MNLNKLKELEAKAGDGDFRAGAALMAELRNSAKEMISTIERYKAALETVEKYKPQSFSSGDYSYRYLTDIAIEALKDPEKTPSP